MRREKAFERKLCSVSEPILGQPCFVCGYTRLFPSKLGFSADEVGLLMALDCAGAMVLQPLLARVIEGPGRVTMRHVLLGMSLVALFAGGLLYFQHNFLDAYLYDVILSVGGDTRSLGTALLIGAGVETPMMLLFAFVAKRFGVNRSLRFSAAAMALKPWLILLAGTVWGVYLMRFSHFVSFAPFLLALTYYANERMADSDKVTGQALITGAVSLAGMFSYLTGGMLVSGRGALGALLLCTLIGMAGGALFLLFAVRDQKEKA